jgi:hypothetical protein
MTLLVVVLMTETDDDPRFATYAREPELLNFRSCGFLPTAMVAATVEVCGTSAYAGTASPALPTPRMAATTSAGSVRRAARFLERAAI